MLALLGIVTILSLLVLIMSKKASPVVALIMVPVIAALAGGFTTEIATFITEGLKSIAPTAVMFVFAILFFGVLTDAGTFEPIIRRLLRAAGNDPVRITVATALLAMIVHLDGSGAVTFLITIPAMLPLYDALSMKKTTLATVTALAAGTMNILPWGGPTIRAATALNLAVTDLFNPLLLPVLCGLGFVLFISYILGQAERKRIRWSGTETVLVVSSENEQQSQIAKRPWLMWFNFILILLAVTALITAFVPPHIVFMIAFAAAITVNYPLPSRQRELIDAHAPAALLMAGVLFAAGCFTGILQHSGMIDAMAAAAVEYVPESVGRHLASLTGLCSMPASLLFDPDSFYFGVLPLLSTTAVHFGGDAVEVGRAAVIGQMTTGFPVSPLTGSTYLLVGLAGVELGDHQRKTIPLAFLTSLVILSVALLTGAISF